MGIFDFFPKTPKPFVSSKAFEANLANQLAMTPATLQELRKHGVNSETELKLEFFFYTNAVEKAKSLAADLTAKKYETKFGVCPSDTGLQLITGWTTKMSMTESVISYWTNEMCNLGLKHDCTFDGWGTNPSQ